MGLTISTHLLIWLTIRRIQSQEDFGLLAVQQKMAEKEMVSQMSHKTLTHQLYKGKGVMSYGLIVWEP